MRVHVAHLGVLHAPAICDYRRPRARELQLFRWRDCPPRLSRRDIRSGRQSTESLLWNLAMGEGIKSVTAGGTVRHQRCSGMLVCQDPENSEPQVTICGPENTRLLSGVLTVH